MATWRNGYAEDCKSLYPSSILGVASKKPIVYLLFFFVKSFNLILTKYIKESTVWRTRYQNAHTSSVLNQIIASIDYLKIA